jgi:hypothetical protein
MLDYLFKKDTKFTDSLIGTGSISGSSIFDIHLRQSLYSESIKYVTCECLKPFISEIGPVVKKAVNNFLGPNQS